MESNIQEIATHIGFMLDSFVYRLVEKFPTTLTRENAHLFLRAFEDIETLTQSGYETAQKVGGRGSGLRCRTYARSFSPSHMGVVQFLY